MKVVTLENVDFENFIHLVFKECVFKMFYIYFECY